MMGLYTQFTTRSYPFLQPTPDRIQSLQLLVLAVVALICVAVSVMPIGVYCVCNIRYDAIWHLSCIAYFFDQTLWLLQFLRCLCVAIL